MGTNNISNSSRAILLDIFRIILCLGVVVYHYTPERCSSGALMVNGFFVLSGFLLGCSFLRKSTFDVIEFYGHKFRRLFPMLFVVALGSIVLHILIGKPLPHWESQAWGAFNLTGFLEYYNPPLWYMVVECTFLLLAPFFYYLLRINKLCVILGGVICLTAFLYSRVPDNAPFGDGLYYSTIARCWQFMAGIAAAWLFIGGRINWFTCLIQKRMFVWFVFSIFCLVSIVMMIIKQQAHLNYWTHSFSFDFITVVFFAFVIPIFYEYRMKCREKVIKLISYLAALTYPIFLLHCLLVKICGKGSKMMFGEVSLEWLLISQVIGTLLLSIILLKMDSYLAKKLDSMWTSSKTI